MSTKTSKSTNQQKQTLLAILPKRDKREKINTDTENLSHDVSAKQNVDTTVNAVNVKQSFSRRVVCPQDNTEVITQSDSFFHSPACVK